jgi:NAD/NADP transhydrogenase alpha subunit
MPRKCRKSIRRQAALTAEHIKKQDIVITTALIPGRPAPKLVTGRWSKSMKPGSVIVDLAASAAAMSKVRSRRRSST